MTLTTPLDQVYLGASIALIALALYFTHAAESATNKDEADDAQKKYGH